jgi:predicted ATPase
VHDRSGGNPFYLEELVALLESEGRLRDPCLHRASNNWVPATVQDVIRRRVSRLPADVQKVLSVASVVGRTFDADVLGAVAEVEQIQLFDLLDVAGQSGLVGAADAPGRFSFSHALVAEALIAELSAPRLAAVHARVVDAIERLRADALEAHVAELAHHAWPTRTRWCIGHARCSRSTRCAPATTRPAPTPRVTTCWSGSARRN